MCLCLFAINKHEDFPFILLANRDEFRERPAAKASFWKDKPNILAGRDLEGMGTWLGINKHGKISFLTNYRHSDFFNRKGPTRGMLVSDFLSGNTEAEEYLKSIENSEDYNGFNLISGNFKDLYYFSNVENRVGKIENGVHGLSNAFLNSSWPKVDLGKTQLSAAIETNNLESDYLFSILKDEKQANPELLPNTGVSDELEKMLSSKFINTKDYGTVCSTVVKADKAGNCLFEERTFNSNGKETDRVEFAFTVTEN
ncbi:MAG: hypothetical protein ACI8P5_000897 [Bacteroidia bacterium]|jgi:uncharacterized protein with NRDE domain